MAGQATPVTQSPATLTPVYLDKSGASSTASLAGENREIDDLTSSPTPLYQVARELARAKISPATTNISGNDADDYSTSASNDDDYSTSSGYSTEYSSDEDDDIASIGARKNSSDYDNSITDIEGEGSTEISSVAEKNREWRGRKVALIRKNLGNAIKDGVAGVKDVGNHYLDLVEDNHVLRFLDDIGVENRMVRYVGNKVDQGATALTTVIHAPFLLLDLVAGFISPASNRQNVLGPVVSLVSDGVFTVVKTAMIALVTLAAIPVAIVNLVVQGLLFVFLFIAKSIYDGVLKLNEFCKENKIESDLKFLEKDFKDSLEEINNVGYFENCYEHIAVYRAKIAKAKDKLENQIQKIEAELQERVSNINNESKREEFEERIEELQKIKKDISTRINYLLQQIENGRQAFVNTGAQFSQGYALLNDDEDDFNVDKNGLFAGMQVNRQPNVAQRINVDGSGGPGDDDESDLFSGLTVSNQAPKADPHGYDRMGENS